MHNNLSPDITRAMLDEIRRVSQGRDRLHTQELLRQRRSRGRRRRAR
jgi:hypothetical protein